VGDVGEEPMLFAVLKDNWELGRVAEEELGGLLTVSGLAGAILANSNIGLGGGLVEK
jgi:hypothetical protein